jgi:hypothetical protein
VLCSAHPQEEAIVLPIYLRIGGYMGDDDDRSRWEEMIISRSCRQKAKNDDLRWCKKFIEIHGKSDELPSYAKLEDEECRATLSGAKAFIHASL